MYTPEQAEIVAKFFAVMSFVLGTVVGSFLNVCICRLPAGESVVKPRSKCPKCGHMIAWYDNIPIISWLVLLRARCRKCGLPISVRYPFVELLTGLLFLWVYFHFGNTIASPIYMLFMASLVVVTFVDIDEMIIPNEITFPGIPLGIACSVVAMLYAGSGLVLNDPIDCLLGLFLGGGSMVFLDRIAVWVLKKPGMGFGDAKLLAMLGAFLGWKAILLIIMLASCVGSIVGVAQMLSGKGKTTIELDEGEEVEGHYLPFGPYLVLGGVIALFYGNELINAYLGLMKG